MSRERGFPVDTPIGTMFLRHVGWGVLIDNSSNTIPEPADPPYLTISGKTFTASVGVYPDGTIERLYVNRADRSKDAAPTYVRRIEEVARETALRWIEENPEQVARGEHYRARMDVYSATAQVERLAPEYREAKRRLAQTSKRLAAAEEKLAQYEPVT